MSENDMFGGFAVVVVVLALLAGAFSSGELSGKRNPYPEVCRALCKTTDTCNVKQGDIKCVNIQGVPQ